MIKTTLVAMTIVGCDCDAKLCEYIGETPAQWTNIADCEAAMKSQVLREGNYSYPLISGICRTAQPSDAKLAAAPPGGLDRRPVAALGNQPASSDLDRRARLYKAVMDSSSVVMLRTGHGYAAAKTSLVRAASETAELARQSANWLVAKLPDGL